MTFGLQMTRMSVTITASRTMETVGVRQLSDWTIGRRTITE